MKIRHVLIPFAIFVSIAFYFLMKIQSDSGFNVSKREILIRKIGDAILLQSGDHTSRVLPVKKLAGETYELQFEKQFSVEPGGLVAIIGKTFAENDKTDYIVNVLDCHSRKVVYGFSVSNNHKKSVIPCLGRNLPSGCYMVHIKFREAAPDIKKHAVGISLLAAALVFPFIIFRFRKKKIPIEKLPKPDQKIPIGTFIFDIENKCLIAEKETINLTTKEARLLAIFAEKPNETIDRARLQKEIWEDEGIIVGRSLDVFVSKLRKKLEPDVGVQLINVHGKGYKLQIKSTAT